MTITFEAETLAEAKQKITDFLNELSINTETNQDPRQLELDFGDQKITVVAPKKSKTKTKAKKSEVITSEAAQVGIDTAAELELADEHTPVTKEQALEALKQINNTGGLEEATKLLHSFGCSRFSELKPDQYAPFVKAANGK